MNSSKSLYYGLGILLVIAIGFGVWRYLAVAGELANAQERLRMSTEKITELEQTIEVALNENADLLDELEEEKERNDEFEERIDDLSGTVGTLEKLSQTDKELLQKYSKVFFLNEHYIPKKLSKISSKYTYDKQKDYYILTDVRSFLNDLLGDAEDDGMELQIISAYRSFDTQSVLKSGYKVTYGSGANQFSADQGYSEHQLGTTVDFTTPTVGASFTGFQNTPEYKWLEDNAHKYGFVLSYPPNNAYYQYEPWHWRFVGEDLARDLHNDGKYFYDLDQRDIDKYLVEIFD